MIYGTKFSTHTLPISSGEIVHRVSQAVVDMMPDRIHNVHIHQTGAYVYLTIRVSSCGQDEEAILHTIRETINKAVNENG